MAVKETHVQVCCCFTVSFFQLSMMAATGLAARDPQMSHKLMFDGPMSPAAASKSVTSTKWRH